MATTPSAAAQFAERQAQQPTFQQYALQAQQLKNAQTQQQTAALQQTGLEQENQQRALALKDQQTLRSIAPNHLQKDADGNVTGFDTEGLLKEAAGKGVNPQTLNQMRLGYADTVSKLATADKETRDNEQARNKTLYETLESVRSIKDPQQRQAALIQSLPTLKKQGVDISKIQANQPISDDMLDFDEAGLGMHQQMLADAKTQSETQANQAKVTAANTGAQKFAAELPGGPLNRVTQDIAIATNPQIQAGKVAVAKAEGEARAQVEAATARGSNAAVATVPPHLVAPATAAATKAGEEFASAQAVTQRMNATMDAARKGNVVSYQIIPEEGTLQITTSQGVHRINKTEIDQYAGGGSLWQRMEAHAGKTLTGKSIPDSVLNDMAEIQKIQAEGARAKYENSLGAINQTYGAKFKPVDMNSNGKQAHPFFSQFGGTVR